MEQPFGSNANSPFESFGKKIDERFTQALPRVEQEVKKWIAHLNDEVVPQLRQGSSQALRNTAEGLRKLAEQLDNSTGEG